jgi:hypothetical protein
MAFLSHPNSLGVHSVTLHLVRKVGTRLKKKTKFRLTAPKAKEVQLIGDFKGWADAPVSISMRKGMLGTWRTIVRLQPGEHKYRFKVDGDWYNHPEFGEQYIVCHVPTRREWVRESIKKLFNPYSFLSAMLIFSVSALWLWFAEHRNTRLFCYGSLLAVIAGVLHLPRIGNFMFGKEILSLVKDSKSKDAEEKVTFATILAFVGLIAFDISYLNMVNSTRDNALSKAGPANYRGDWAAMEGGHIVVFFGILICLAWFARRLNVHRPLQTLWTVTLVIFLFHLWGKLDDANQIFFRRIDRQFEVEIQKRAPGQMNIEEFRYSDDYKKVRVFLSFSNQTFCVRTQVDFTNNGFRTYNGSWPIFSKSLTNLTLTNLSWTNLDVILPKE